MIARNGLSIPAHALARLVDEIPNGPQKNRDCEAAKAAMVEAVEKGLNKFEVFLAARAAILASRAGTLPRSKPD